ncbi:MAG TPA: M48 family metallopeptidase [Flavisolibacter sp.]|nr:M48 family metallopeptidase [Flavisolibacter sp.]
MDNASILYYNGVTAQPTEVSLQILGDEIYLYDVDGLSLNKGFPLSGITCNRIGTMSFVYLDTSGLHYIQLPSSDPIAHQIAQEIGKGATKNWTQRLMRQRTHILLILAVALCAALYFFLINLIPFAGMKLINVQNEMVIGDKLHEAMMKEARLIGNDSDTIGSKLLQDFADNLQLSNTYRLRFTLMDNDLVNAYALPGGNIVVYKGILRKIKSPEELTALLSHESSHINQRHSLKSLLRSGANSILISIVFGDATGISGALAGNADALNGLRYSRSLEREADSKGIELMLANKIPVTGMVDLMRTLKKEENFPSELSFLSTHPMTSERINVAVDFARRHPNAEQLQPNLISIFEQLKERTEKK